MTKYHYPFTSKQWPHSTGLYSDSSAWHDWQGGKVAGSPYPFYEDQWQVYATGAFLLGGKEMIKMRKGGKHDSQHASE
jgi:hypothetical protein